MHLVSLVKENELIKMHVVSNFKVILVGVVADQPNPQTLTLFLKDRF